MASRKKSRKYYHHLKYFSLLGLYQGVGLITAMLLARNLLMPALQLGHFVCFIKHACLTTRLTRKYPQQNKKLRLPQNHKK